MSNVSNLKNPPATLDPTQVQLLILDPTQVQLLIELLDKAAVPVRVGREAADLMTQLQRAREGFAE